MLQDLNLLRVFDAVMEERNVTAAAARLGQSQSTVSAALSRLREALGDELFLRARYGVVPTERALAVAPVIGKTLAQLDQVFIEAPSFDPAADARRFIVAASAYFECVLIPQLMTHAASAAPRVSVIVRPLGPDLGPAGLSTGEVDLALGRFEAPPDNLVVGELIEDDFLCLVRQEDAPNGTSGKARLSRGHFETLRHVVVLPPGRWRTGLFQRLEEAGLTRTPTLTVSHFLAAPLTVAEMGGCATLPRRVAHLFARDRRFALLEPPVDLGRFPMQMAWHPRHRRDPGHAWLRNLIRELCTEIAARPAVA